MNQKRFISLIRYQLHDFKNASFIMYLCVYIVFSIDLVKHLFTASNVHVFTGGNEMISMVTLFVFGLNSFKDNFNFFSISGISRKTQFLSTLSFFGILCALFALVDTLNAAIFSQLSNYAPLFLQLYGPAFTDSGALLRILPVNFLLLWVFYFFLTMVGLFITILYYRMNRSAKIAVSVAIPLVLLNGVNALDSYVFQGRISMMIRQAFYFIWGLSGGYHPFISIGSHLLLAACFTALAFLLLRRAVVKK